MRKPSLVKFEDDEKNSEDDSSSEEEEEENPESDSERDSESSSVVSETDSEKNSETDSGDEKEKEEPPSSSPSIFNKIYNFTSGLASNLLNNGVETVSDFLDVDANDPSNGAKLKENTERISKMTNIIEPIAAPILKKTAKNVGKLIGQAVNDASKTAILGARDVIETIPGASVLMLANDATKMVQSGVHVASKLTEEVSDTITKLNDAVDESLKATKMNEVISANNPLKEAMSANNPLKEAMSANNPLKEAISANNPLNEVVDRSTRIRAKDLINRKKTLKHVETTVGGGGGGRTKRKYQKRVKKVNNHTKKDQTELVKDRVQKNINKYIPSVATTRKKKIDHKNI
jgi:hypothetical protein